MSKSKPPPSSEMAPELAETQKIFADACDELAEMGVEEVCIKYDGYGDSGCIDEVIATGGGNEIELPDPLDEVLTEAAENLLPGGWDDDSGAFGQIKLDVVGKRLTREHNWRIEEAQYEEENWDL